MNELKQLQYTEVCSRLRQYAAHQWQAPLSYVAILILILGSVADKSLAVRALGSGIAMLTGILVLIIVIAITRAEKRNIDIMAQIEAESDLQPSAEYHPWRYPACAIIFLCLLIAFCLVTLLCSICRLCTSVAAG